MRILLISNAFSGMTQRFFTELRDAGYCVSVELHTGNTGQLVEGVNLFRPDLILCPFLTRKIPADIHQKFRTLIVHPGIPGDRGPSSLDWAIQNGESEWGVTLLEASEQMDSGDIWSTRVFPLRKSSKSSIFNREVTEAAVDCLWEVLTYMESPDFKPQPLNYRDPEVRGRLQPKMGQQDRAIDWKRHSTGEILNRLHAADGSPGVLDQICGREYYLFNAHRAENLRGEPGRIIASSNGAICRATIDGAVWIGHLKPRTANGRLPVKLPALDLLKDRLPEPVPEISIDYTRPGRQQPCQEVWYETRENVACIHSPFHNGGFSTEQCRLFLKVYRHVESLPVDVIVLMGGEESWSNGIHLNRIQVASDPAQESWLNINAIDDLVYRIVTTMDKVTISAIAGNTGAGGAIVPLAADFVYAREGVVLNPHYRNMGGLFGSEYWTYLLPRRVGEEMAEELTGRCLPISARRAWSIGFVDQLLDRDHTLFYAQVRHIAARIASDRHQLRQILGDKADIRCRDESTRPLAAYRKSELTKMYANFYGSEDYHSAREAFVRKIPATTTPPNIAIHRKHRPRFQIFAGRA